MHKLKSYAITAITMFVLLFILGNVCPMEHITGFPCPGCNMFTALYWLFIKMDIQTAYYFHPAVFAFVGCSILFIVCYVYYRSWEKVIHNKYVIFIGIMFMIVLLGVYIERMIYVFPQEPMVFNHKAILPQLFN